MSRKGRNSRNYKFFRIYIICGALSLVQVGPCTQKDHLPSSTPGFIVMELIAIYAIAAGGVIASFVLVKTLHDLSSLQKILSVFASKCLSYPYLLGHHRLIGPWACADVLFHLLYIAINLFCLFFGTSSASDIGRHAGELSLSNMMFLFLSPQLKILFNILGISLRTCRRIHGSTAWMSLIHLIVHIATAILIKHVDFLVSHASNLFAVIVS